jgi:dCMP deaminase
VRFTTDEYMMALALVAQHQTTCIRRGVGCVLVDERNHVLSIGYNGVAAKMPHCNEGHPCVGCDLPPGQDSCEAVHAEVNAVLQCPDPWKITTAYVTLSPCKSCVKILLNTGCQRIVFREEHTDPVAKAIWLKTGREWAQMA